MKTNNTNNTTAKKTLMSAWDGLIASGDMTAEEMAESLRDQITGYADLSAEELTGEMADILGWDIDDITDEQLDAWCDIVDAAAKEWLADHQ